MIQKARMLKAEKEREKRKLEAEEKKAEEERLKKEKKAKKKKAKEANATDTDEKVSEEVPPTESTGKSYHPLPSLPWSSLVRALGCITATLFLSLSFWTGSDYYAALMVATMFAWHNLHSPCFRGAA